MSVISPAFQVLVQHETLSDGTKLKIRRIEPEDCARLQAFHDGLGFESIYLRHLSGHKVLTSPQAAHLCSVDCYDRMAFVATVESDGEEHIVGVVRYERLTGGLSYSAAVSIIVQDAFQRRGIGTRLFGRLASYARCRGIRKFTATFLLENAGLLQLLKRSGLPMNLVFLEIGRLQAYMSLDPAV